MEVGDLTRILKPKKIQLQGISLRCEDGIREFYQFTLISIQLSKPRKSKLRIN